MEALAGGDLFLKVIEAYSRPTRIIRGKDIGTDVEVSMLKIICTGTLLAIVQKLLHSVS